MNVEPMQKNSTLSFQRSKLKTELFSQEISRGIVMKALATYMQRMSVCCPSMRGCFSITSSFAAAVVHSLPVITTRGEMLEAPFLDGENVLLTPPKNPEMMADRIRMLIDDVFLQQKLRNGAQQLAQEWFAWDMAVERIMASLAS